MLNCLLGILFKAVGGTKGYKIDELFYLEPSSPQPTRIKDKRSWIEENQNQIREKSKGNTIGI
jgi:hypothetical protein